MKNFKKLAQLSVLILATSVLGACASMDHQRAKTPDPNARLDQMLFLYTQARTEGRNCTEIWNANHAMVDCQRIQRELDRLYAEFPHHERIVMTNAVMQYEAGRSDNAQFMLDQLLSRSGPHPEAAILRSRIALTEGNTTRARELLLAQINLAPDYAELHEALAAAHYIEGRYDNARKALRMAGKLGAPTARVAYHRGLLHEAEGHPELACSDYQVSIRLQPSFRAAMARLIGLSEDPACSEISEALQAYRGR